MGKWVILIGDESFSPDTIAKISFDGAEKILITEDRTDVFYRGYNAAKKIDGNGFLYTDKDTADHISFLCCGSDTLEYTPEELALLPYKNPHFIIMKYSSAELLKKVIALESFPRDILIDCDGEALGLENIIGTSGIVNFDNSEELI